MKRQLLFILILTSEFVSINSMEYKTKRKVSTEQNFKKIKKRSRKKTINSIPQLVPYQTAIQKCNKLSLSVDGSFITIDSNNQVAFVIDPKFNKKFSFPFNQAEFNFNIEPKPFKYDERVKQQLALTSSNKDPHKFGIAVDYLMQLFGTSTCFERKTQSLIHAAVLLSSMQNGEFQYGFYKSQKNTYKLYHRFFKKLSKTIYEDKYYSIDAPMVTNDTLQFKPNSIKLNRTKRTWQKKVPVTTIQPSSNV